MKKAYFTGLWLSLLLIPGLTIGGPPSYTGHNVDLDPGIQVIDNADGSALVSGYFKLFNNQAPSDVLYPADFTVKVDGNPVQATIVRPPKPKAMADVVFCMDISGSMSDEIQAVKTHTQAFVNKLTSQHFDVRLGLITFGQRPQPFLRQLNNGHFYATEQDFINEVSGLNASGGTEEWFDCLVQASQYPYRYGAERITLLITDENGDPKQYNINSAMPVVKNNASKVYGISYGHLGNVVQAVNQTNGQLYNIRDPFESILDSIANSIINTYSVSLLTHVGPGEHWLHVTPSANEPGGEDKEPFKIGANPVISLSQVTQDMINQGVILGTSPLNIEASVTDPDGGSIQTVNISWLDPAAIPTTNAMSTGGANLYNYTYGGTLNVNDCFAFAIQAIDNEGRNTSVPANQGNAPGGQWRICAEDPTPVIGTITPDTYDYQQPVSVSAQINDVPSGPASLAVTLKYRETGEVLWGNMPMSESGGLFTATIPDLVAGFKGLDVEVVAQDISNNVSTKGHKLAVNTVPVSIIDVTRHTDTLDTGPFAIHAIVAGLDTTSAGQVDLVYTINGGTATTLPMTQAVTGANASLSSQTNLYIERIPTVNLGEKVCYFVQASNPTANTQSQEHCFETLQPAAPLSITPTSAIMAVGDNALEFMAAGGYGTYGWNTLNGSLSTTLADKTLYTPTLAGSDKLSVQDLKGFTATVIINVLPALTLDPAVDGKHFSPTSTLQLTASGAESPYQWKIDGATSQISGNDNESVEITLGAEPATIQVTLTDAKGRTKTATFNNDGQLKIDPAGPEIAVTPDSETAFTAIGGDGAYIWTVVGGDVDDPHAANVNYKSPGLPGVYHLTVSDNSGASASVTV
ncbi:MAG: vWA domain-containing protein, partial [Candidatus Parabeggiatoa sp.]|nr:vWA domain-containing protein [Candidatus Parabeggiatoa sp.]